MVDNSLSAIEHVVVLMLENRSFDHMLGFLYPGNVTPTGQPFEGLTGKESNPDRAGTEVPVFRIEPSTPNAYFMPGADPGEGYLATNSQIYGQTAAPTTPITPGMRGFVTDYDYTLGWETREKWPILAGTTASGIMGCFTPQSLPVLSVLATGYAVCDHWFASAPTETLPNRAFVCSGTSQGHMDDKTHTFTSPSVFGLLGGHGITWGIYGYTDEPLTKGTFTDIPAAQHGTIGLFKDFTATAAAGTLPAFSFLEPSWSSDGNSQHPNYDVALGEQFIHDVYYALRNGPTWPKTLLVITYDEHGGCYDHVPPPGGAVPPDNTAGEFGFDFTRFGLRVPTVLVSPLIPPNTVFRVPAGSTPLDHTSILKTVQRRWSLPSLTARDAAAPDFAAVLSLTTPRTDDPLANVTVPVSTGQNPSAGIPSHLQEVAAELVSRHERPGVPMPTLRTAADYEGYLAAHTHK